MTAWYLTPVGLVACIYTFVGALLYFFPPKKINLFIGYRTPQSRANQQNWDFAQRYSGKLFVYTGLVMALIANVLNRINIFQNNQQAYNLISLTLVLSGAFLTIYLTERALKKLPRKK